MNAYGNYVKVESATRQMIARCEDQMRQEALKFLQNMDQPIEKMGDLQIIVRERDGCATVGWKVYI